ncbi:hypothetical protein BG011_006823 [Mortierella polycephala]|uniref:Uncharacterized protein n=1 Tax=Mortierella polycephala TaxID=41804 RepID=A0A9P6PV82_9FUNG|nr:hypothetical protein BG011_006823 [Mortierella polycephala]
MEAVFNTTPSDIVSAIEARLIARNVGDTRLASLATFCEELATFRGPDDALTKLLPRIRSNGSNRSNSGAHGHDQESNKRVGKYHCKKCVYNNTHPTEKCVTCDNYHKRGHLVAETPFTHQREHYSSVNRGRINN